MTARAEIAVHIANKTTAGGALTGVVGWATQINWIGLSGLVIAAIGAAASIYYQRRRDQRESAESEARMQALRERAEGDRRKQGIPVKYDRRKKQCGQINRYLVSGMALSAAALITLAASEGFTPEAMIPVRGDPPTVGFGSTVHEDGAPVRMGDRLDPVRALVTMRAHVSRDEAAFQRSLPGVSLSQSEYDVYLDFIYQYGIDAWNKSSMRRHLRAGEYRAACDALLMYRYASGFDCSTPGNKACSGVWTRQLDRHAKCVAAQ